MVVLIALAGGPASAAQRPFAPPRPVPDGTGSWLAHLVVSGGILGNGADQITIDSRGRVSCRPAARCRAGVDDAALAAMGRTIAALSTTGLEGSRAHSICSDCYVTRLTVWRRGPDGVSRSNDYEWAEIDPVPADVRQMRATIREAALAGDGIRTSR